MKILYESSFEKDINKIVDNNIKQSILRVIWQIKSASSVREIKNLKKLKTTKNYYRIKIGDYRIGLEYENDILIFVRCLHRKDIYRYFP